MRKVTPYLVLLYHGVIHDEDAIGPRNSSGKHITASAFDQQMRYLKENSVAVSMQKIAAAHRGEVDLEPGSVAVTFDDGYLNNRDIAWPILERHGIPATIYLTTGFIGSKKLMWTDALEDTLLAVEEPSIVLDYRGQREVFAMRDIEQRVRALGRIKRICKQLDVEERQRILDGFGVPSVKVESSPFWSWLTWDDVRELQRSELIDFGAHTVNHVSLARVSHSTMRHEIDQSLEATSKETGVPCRLFAYPEGGHSDFSEVVISHLLSRGLDHAPSALPGVNYLERTSPFRIKRIMVGFEGQTFPNDLISDAMASS